MIRTTVVALSILFAVLLSGCGHLELMPTPNMFKDSKENPFTNVPPELRHSHIDVIFATDRFPEQRRASDPVAFGYERSSHLHVGKSRMTIGKGLTWDELVEASLSGKRGKRFILHMAEPDILFRYPGSYWRAARIDDPSDSYEEFMERRLEARKQLHKLIDADLEHTPTKEVFLFVHGYNNSFDDAIRTIGNLWHFLGREGVPIAYTWPAGAGGLTGYTTDRESCDFTIFHFKLFLEDLAADPNIERIHLLSHSRGTDVATTALRELALVARAKGEDPRETLKIGNLILASPDIDMDVAAQRLASERVPAIPERMTIYMSPNDRALALSSWLQGSWARLGLVDVDKMTAAQLQTMTSFKNVDFIDSRVSKDFIGHSYFYNNPAVSSDVILLLRDDRLPGEANGRPLEQLAPELWRIENGYPIPPKRLLPFLPAIP